MNNIIFYKNYLKNEIDNKEFDNIELQALNLMDNFEFKNPSKIINFIHENPNFIKIFDEILPILHKYYPLKKYLIEYIPDYDDESQDSLCLYMKSEHTNSQKKINIYKACFEEICPILKKYDLLSNFILGVGLKWN